jgi:hypothetical protein
MFEDLNVWMFECLCPSRAGLKLLLMHCMLVPQIKKLMDMFSSFHSAFHINTCLHPTSLISPDPVGQTL